MSESRCPVLKHYRCPQVDEERREWQDPNAILLGIGLKKGKTFVDVGCGEGFFAIPAARLVGESGKVYGLDIDEEAIDILRENAKKEKLGNLKLKVGAAEDTILCKGCADVVFFGIDLHDFNNPEKVLLNARRMLRPSGRLVDVDWKKEPMGIGPPLKIRFSKDEAVRRIEQAGFRTVVVKDAGPYFYLIIAKI